MGWLFFAALTVVLWSIWSFVGKIALRTATPIQATIVFAIATLMVGIVALVAGQRSGSWSPGTLWPAAISALGGGLGMITFYLALERGKASVVAPVIGLYPAVVVVLSVCFLGESLSVLQYVGIVMAVTGVMLVGAGA